MSLDIDPLYVGMTRPTMMGGVTLPAFIFNLTLSALVFIATKNIFYLAVFAPLHGVGYLVCLTEPRQFELISLWLKTKGRNLNKRYWLSNSYSPFENFREKVEKTQSEKNKK